MALGGSVYTLLRVGFQGPVVGGNRRPGQKAWFDPEPRCRPWLQKVARIQCLARLAKFLAVLLPPRPLGVLEGLLGFEVPSRSGIAARASAIEAEPDLAWVSPVVPGAEVLKDFLDAWLELI